MTPKLFYDMEKCVLKIDDLEIETATDINIHSQGCEMPSEVTLKFMADVTLLPPLREGETRHYTTVETEYIHSL